MKTKKTTLYAIAFCLFILPTMASAQSSFGLRTGIAATTLSAKGDLYNDNNVTYSFTAGAFSTLSLNKSFAVQPEVNYIRKGRSNETTELNTTVKTDFLLHYLQVPVMLKYRNSDLLDKSEFYINCGPYAAFVLKNDTRLSDDNETAALVQIEDSKNTDWGVAFGIGFMTPICKNNICFDLRYDMGLTEIEKQPTDYRTKALSLTVGIQF